MVGGHTMFDDFGRRRRVGLLAGSPRLHRFRSAVARTLRLEQRAVPPPGVLVVLRRGIRSFENEEELLGSSLAERVERITGLPLSYVRLEALDVEEQFARVAAARILVGNHGAGLTWAALLPNEVHSCAVLEMYANASSDGLPVDIRHFAGIAGVRHVPLPQMTSARCRGQLIRACGVVHVDVEALLEAIVATARALLHPAGTEGARARPAAPGGDRGGRGCGSRASGHRRHSADQSSD